TFAYLVPALLSGKRVIVSTGTRNLQDQLFHRDLPRVLSILGAKADVALLKGRANYLCRYRLQQTVESGQFKSRTQGDDLQKVRSWSARTRTGDRAELVEVPESSPLWPRVTSTAENCLGTECPLYDDCFVFKARRHAQDADLVVVNHHLLLSDLALKREGFGAILPEAEAYVLDEAHQLPELAGQYFFGWHQCAAGEGTRGRRVGGMRGSARRIGLAAAGTGFRERRAPQGSARVRHVAEARRLRTDGSRRRCRGSAGESWQCAGRSGRCADGPGRAFQGPRQRARALRGAGPAPAAHRGSRRRGRGALVRVVRPRFRVERDAA